MVDGFTVKGQSLRGGAALALAIALVFSLMSSTVGFAQGDGQSPEEIFKEVKSVLWDLFHNVSAAHREPTEGNYGNVRSTAARLSSLLDSLQKYLDAHQDAEDAPSLRERIDDFREFQKLASLPDNRDIFLTSEVDTRAKITYKPEVGFTKEASQANVSGRVALLAVLTLDGSVKNIVPLKSLGYGLTEKAIEAARKIRFEPAIKGGRRVSQVVVIEYSFNV